MEQCNICPVDRKHRLDPKTFKKDFETDNFIKNHVAICTNLINGCDWRGKVSQYSEHLQKCPKTLINCTNGGCNTKYFLEDEIEHKKNCEFMLFGCDFCNNNFMRNELVDHTNNCDEAPVQCANKCGVTISRKLYSKHLQEYCINTIIKCPFPGCEVVEKKQYINTEHVNNCEYRKIKCRYCNNEIRFCDETQHFYNNCAMYPIPCTLNCNLLIPRCEMSRHIDEYCENLVVNCKWKWCQYRQERKFISTHQSECQFRLDECQYCRQEVSLGDLNRHYDNCMYYPVKCPQDCGEFIRKNQIQLHIKNDCMNTVIPCSYVENGCNMIMKRKDLEGHLNNSNEYHSGLISNQIFKSLKIMR